MATGSARQEWAANWPLPFLGMLGVAGSATLGYSSGVFMLPITQDFGWSRAQFSSAFTVQMLVGLIVAPIVGRLIDRIGPRRVATIGVVAFVPGFAALGLANGTPWQWWLLGGVQSVCTALISMTVWMAAIVPRFHVSRGLALAVALAGMGVATAVWPVLAAAFIPHIGWRATFGAMILCWGVPMIPLTFLLMRDPPPIEAPAATAQADVPSQIYWRTLFSRSFLCITLAGGLYSSMAYAMVLHSVPLLQQAGMSLSAAAGLAGTAGICAVIGRLGTGFLLDRFPTRPIAVIVFLLPIIVSQLFRLGGGTWETALVAVILLGLSQGAEVDVIAYTASRHFGRQVFASIFSVSVALFSLFAALGPLLASAIFDATKSYNLFLIIVAPVVIVATTLMAIVLSPASERRARAGFQTIQPENAP